jgi:hypothetical protein
MNAKRLTVQRVTIMVLVLVLGGIGGKDLLSGRVHAAPQAPSATATLYPGGSVTSGYLETLWGGTGSARVLAPQTFLFGNGIPAPDLNPLNNSNSWRSLAPAGGSVQFIGGALRLYSPASGQTGWHNVNNTAACFGGCLGSPTGASVSLSGLPNLVLQHRLNSGDASSGQGSIFVFGINQIHLSPQRWAALEVAVIGAARGRLAWTTSGISGLQYSPETNPMCPNSATHGVAYRLQVGVTQLAGGHSGDEPSNGGWPPGGWLPWPHTNSPLSATDTPPAAKRLASK